MPVRQCDKRCRSKAKAWTSGGSAGKAMSLCSNQAREGCSYACSHTNTDAAACVSPWRACTYAGKYSLRVQRTSMHASLSHDTWKKTNNRMDIWIPKTAVREFVDELTRHSAASLPRLLDQISQQDALYYRVISSLTGTTIKYHCFCKRTCSLVVS